MIKVHGFIGRIVAVAAALLVTGAVMAQTPKKTTAPKKSKMENLVVAGGCFWCIETLFIELKGVSAVESGYAGGDTPHPTYEQVCTGQTGHAEAVKITFDPKVISAEDLLHIFFTVHDPTSKNRQGGDSGTQYRSVIFYSTEAEKLRGQKMIAEINREKIWDHPLVTTLEPLHNYSKAEAYHQNYYGKYENGTAAQRAGMNTGYCQAIISPKVLKFREKYRAKLKK